MSDCNKTDIQHNDTFCVLPWIHLHIWPNGNTYPCCAAPSNKPFGSAATTSVIDIWNNDSFKNLRKAMLNQEQSDTCRVCYKAEKYNAGLSMRRGLNDKFINQVLPLLDKTSSDGSLSEMDLLYWDYRFSNLCNLKCRTCGPDLSSSWTADHELLYNRKRPVTFIKDQTIQENLNILIDQNIDQVQEIYFAGGEPLLMAEHYDIICRLLDSGRCSDVRLRYSTNLSSLTFKGMDFTTIWPRFKEVIVGVSLDEIGERAEYWRAGTNWKRMKNNLQVLSELTKQHPSITMPFYPTISIFNMHRLFEIFSEIHTLGALHTKNQVWFNILNEPAFYNFEIAPMKLKELAIANLRKLQALFDSIIESKQIESFPVQETIDGAIARLMSETHESTDALTRFVEMTNKLDIIRNEKLEHIAPELYDLLMRDI